MRCVNSGRPTQLALLALLLVFSAAFPLAKIVLALTLWYRTDRAGPRLLRSLSLLAELAKWSMLDVFVVALTVIGIQVAVIGNASSIRASMPSSPPSCYR